MNKTVTINISGIIFHIEEDAFEKLSKYLSTIKGYFSKTDGGSEIMSDIEARIAEMLQGKTSPVKQVVLMTDVDSVMETMGKPEEFAGDSEPETQNNKQEEDSQYTSGESIKKRLFRDPDHKAIGGVCSGIAAYFDVDMIWIRLAMVLLTFAAGMSIWVYIILWIVIPEAKTTAEKLAMKGEKIDINNISKSVKEEADQLKKRAQKFGNEMKNNSGQFQNDSRNFFDKLGEFIKEFMIIVSKFFVRVVGLILLIFGVVFMLGLMSSIFGFSIVGANTDMNDWINLFFMERSHYTLGLIGLILFLGIPFIMMIYGGVKLLFKIHYTNRWLNIGAGLVWFVGLIIVLFVSIKTGKDFNESARVKDPVQIISQKDTLYLTLTKGRDLMNSLHLNDEDYEDTDNDGRRVKVHTHHSDYVVGNNEKGKFIVGYANLNILPSNSDKFELYVIRKARGEDKRSAVTRAKAIDYKINQTDSLIAFDELFTVPNIEKFRVQDVQVILRVPKNKVVYLDKSLEHFIYDIENVSNTFDGDMVGRRWIMTGDGLKCIDCDGLDIEDEDKKYDGTPAPPAPPSEPAPININGKDANVKIDKDGINVQSKDGNVNITKDGIHIKTNKEEKK